MSSKKETGDTSEETVQGKYQPGVYTSSVTLNGNPMDITVTLDANHINDISLSNMSDTITTMYPLVQPAFDDIAKQIINTQSTENIKFDESSQYTYSMIYNAITDTIASGMTDEQQKN